MQQVPSQSGVRPVRTSRVDVAAVPSITEPQMRMVLDVSRLLAVPTELDELLRRIAEASTVLLGCERASIFLYDERRKELWTKVALGSSEIRIPAHKGIAGYCFGHAELVCVADPYHDPRFNPEPDRRSGFVTRNLLTAPMLDLDGRPLGVVQAINKLGVAAAGDDSGVGLAGGFTDADHALIQLLAEQAGVAMQRHNLQAQAMENIGLRREMDLARATQQALLPRHLPRLPWLDARGWNCPASITGGDCWDMWLLPDGRLGVFLADASGHGIGPALVVSQARTLVRAIADADTDPHGVLARVNGRLSEDLEWGRFVTAFLGYLSPDGWLHWSSAGHGPALVRQAPDAALEPLDPPVQPLGVVDEWSEDAPEPIRFEPGGTLALVSDGIFEAANPAGEMFGVERLKQHVGAMQGRPSSEAVDALCAAVHDWQGGDEAMDDQTIVVVRRTV